MDAKRWWLLSQVFLVFLFMFSFSVNANINTVNVTLSELVWEKVAYNPQTGEYSSGNATWNSSYQLQAASARGIINITNVGTEDISDFNLTMNNTQYLSSWPSIWSAPSGLVALGGPVERSGGAPGVGEDWWVYATILRPGDSLIYNYTMTISPEIVNISESYSASKVIEGGTFTLNLTVENSLTSPVNVSNVRITKTPGRYYDQSGSYVYFNFSNLAGPDSGNADLLSYATSYRSLSWNVTNLGNITPTYLGGSRYTVLFDVTAPESLNGTFPTSEGTWKNQTWGAYLLVGEIIVNVTMADSVSTLEIESVRGTSTATLNVNKQRINATHWNTSASFNNTATSLDYNLERITIWSTNYTAGSFNPESGVIANSLNSNSPSASIANGSSWSGLYKTFAWDWVPIVWANASFNILDDGNQIQKITETRSEDGEYMYISEMFVLKGGYLIKVTKEITPLSVAGNVYNVTILLENVGTEKTPDWVSMFDLIPPNFVLLEADDPSVSFGNRDISGAGIRYVVAQVSLLRGVQSFAAIVGGSYDNYQGYRADFNEIMNGSNGDGIYDAGSSEVLFRYLINGTGSLSRVGNAFLVGIDPQRADGSVSSVESPDTSFGFLKFSSPEKIITVFSVFVAMTALIAGLVLNRMKR